MKQIYFAIILLVISLSLGVYVYVDYSFSPGDQKILKRWPDPVLKGGPMVVMFLHPACRCSLASISELTRLRAKLPLDVRFKIILNSYEKNEESTKELVAKLREDHFTFAIDRNSRLSEKVGVQTSGETFVLEDDGRIIFQGGITPGRGIEGATSGQAHIISYFKTRSPASLVDSTYGCGLTKKKL